jgi:hypothetical protein
MTSEGVTPVPEEPLPGELEALDEAKHELAEGKTRRLDDVLHGLGRKIKVAEPSEHYLAPSFVPGLEPGIHENRLPCFRRLVDGRVEPGHKRRIESSIRA